MGQNQPLKLSEEEQKELPIGLLWEWWTAATQALVDAVGSEEALKALRPYYLNANNAASQIASSYFTELAKDPDFLSMMGIFAAESWFGGKATIEASDNFSVLEIHGCRTRGECKELCQMTCKELMDNQAQYKSREAFAVLEKSLCKGDDFCRILIGTTEGMIGQDSKEFREVRHPDISEWEFHSFQMQYLSESWVFTTRAMIDRLGAQVARERLCSFMRRSGLSYGIKAMRMFEGEPKAAVVQGVIRSINDGHFKKGKTQVCDGSIEEEVEECPFSQAPQEVCLQYEAFFNGICDAIDPDSEFRYHRMMTDGDRTCYSTIRKKGESLKEKTKEEVAIGDPVKMLALRLAKGEISEDEFDRKRRLLKGV
jgi:hypothetical protein